MKMNSKTFPIITTERLILKQLSLDNLDAIFALRTNSFVNKYLNRSVPKTKEEVIHFINSINNAISEGTTYYWTISLTDTKECIGTVSLFDFANENKSCEIGYELIPEFQGKGFMKEAVQAVITYVFQALNFQKIVACTHIDNQSSTQLLLKLNFFKTAESLEENPNLKMFTLEQ